MRRHHKVDGLQIAIKGFMAFSKFGDVWMGGHDLDRLQEFIRQHPQLKLEPQIYEVSSREGDVRVVRPHYLRERHATALEAILSPAVQKRKQRRSLLTGDLNSGLTGRED